MSIAAIIVNYRTGALVLSHLAQIRRELGTVPGSHLFIVDNNSPGDDAALLASGTAGMDDVSVIAAPENGGFSYGNNRGIEQADQYADFSHIYLLNPDAYPLDGCLQALLAFQADHPQAAILGSQLEGADGQVQRSAFRFMTVASEFEGAAQTGPISRLLKSKIVAPPIQNAAHAVDWVCGASMLIDRAVLDQIGMMDETYFLYYEEVDFQYAAKKAGFEVWYVPQARAVHLVGQSTDMKDGKQRAGAVPPYWYASRRYYFTKNHGRAYGILADLGWVGGKLIHTVRQLLGRRSITGAGREIMRLLRGGEGMKNDG